MRYLSPEQVLFIHARVIAETGGEHGLRDLGLLLSAVARPQATFEDQALYTGMAEKAAALLESLVNNHPFVDGNKRTGIAAAVLFLQLNQTTLSASNPDLERFVLSVASGKESIASITAWFKTHSTSDR